MSVAIEGGSVSRIRGDARHPANFGEICAKAVHLAPTIRPSGRALYPLVRERRGGALMRKSWDDALDYVARRLRAIIASSGPDAIAFYGSGQLMTEDYYVFNKLVKGFLSTNNFDTNSRLCMSSAVAAYTMALGSDGPPCAYADIELADLFLIVGSNTAWCHPITSRRLEKRKRADPERVKIIVVDPRRTETADFADLHLPIRPGTDIALLNAMLSTMIREGLIDDDFIRQHTTGWSAVRDRVLEWPQARAAQICQVPEGEIARAARWFGRAEAAMTLWSMGVNQSTSGTAKALAIINLHLASGAIGRAGCGPFSLTGQPNAMGGREVGGLSHLLPGYRRVEDSEHRAQVAHLWGVEPERISARRGLSAVAMFEGLARGAVKAIWIICTNPAVSMPDLDLVDRALRYAELVVVQDSFENTDTAAYADVILPAAQWPEKEGVMTNSERRISYLPRLVDPPGEALPDWEIAARAARALGFSEAFSFSSAEAAFEEYKLLTRGRPTDISGLSYARLRSGPVQWPCPDPHHPGTPRLYSDYKFNTQDGRARFIAVDNLPPAEMPDAAFPLILTTGRIRNQWHTMTRTGAAPALVKAVPEPYIQINSEDAAAAGITDGCFAEVRSRRGLFVAQARVTAEIARGVCFIPFHWGRQRGFFKAANNLTTRARDSISEQPELKFCAISVRRVDDPAPSGRMIVK